MSNNNNTNGDGLRRRGIITIAVILAIIMLVAVMILIMVAVNSGDQGQNQPTDPSGSTEATGQSQTPSESTAPDVTEEPTDETDPLASTEESTAPSTYVPPTVPPPTTPPKTVISLPYTIPGTTLVIQRVSNYSGIYLEDASNEEVDNVAMMLLYNSGAEAVEYASITLTYDDKTLQFVVSAIPAGGYVAVQEDNRASCASGDLTKAAADVATIASMEMSQGVVQVVDNGDNSLTVTNISGQDIVTVRIFYKYYLTDEKAYVGGITYTAKLSNLKAGESITLTPSHYSSDASTVVMVRTYDTDA